MRKTLDRTFQNTIVPGIGAALQSTFGEETGSLLYACAADRLCFLTAATELPCDPVIRRHIERNILPMIACYQELQKHGISKDAACAFAVDLMHSHAQKAAKTFHRLSHIPYFYAVFRILCRRKIATYYPNTGWNVHWLRDDRHAVAFNFHSCVYRDTTALHHCPELCPFFVKMI